MAQRREADDAIVVEPATRAGTGIPRSLDRLAVLMAAVVLPTLQAIAINRVAGLPYPLC